MDIPKYRFPNWSPCVPLFLPSMHMQRKQLNLSPRHEFRARFLLGSVFVITSWSFCSSLLVGWEKSFKALPRTPNPRAISLRTHIPIHSFYLSIRVIHSSHIKNVWMCTMKPWDQPKAIKPSTVPDLHNMKRRMELGQERETLHGDMDKPDFEPVQGQINIPERARPHGRKGHITPTTTKARLSAVAYIQLHAYWQLLSLDSKPTGFQTPHK